jgi:acetyltransferase
VAVRQNPDAKEDEIIGIGRLIKAYNGSEAQYAILISDQFQGHGLGTYLLSRLVEIGRQEGIDRIIGHILPENHLMQRVSRNVGFDVKYDRVNEAMLAEINLTQ